MNGRNRKTCTAFSLIELLVVIAIIAMLIAILLPVLARAREASNRVVCSSNLRQINFAAQMFANEHHGYMPFAGYTDADLSPTYLNDSFRQNYAYFIPSPGEYKPLPFPIAIAPYLGLNVPSTTYADLQTAVDDPTGVRKYFRCPSAPEPTVTGRFIEDATGVFAPEMYSDFAVNEALMGRDATDYTPRYAGSTRQIPVSSELVVVGDGQPRTEFAPAGKDYVVWYNYAPGRSTLADAFSMAKGGTTSEFNLRRHNNYINIAFLDGHVQTLAITQQNGAVASGELGECVLHP